MTAPLALPSRITLASSVHQGSVTALAQASGLQVDVPAELARDFACLWLAWIPEHQDPAGFLLTWDIADELQVLDIATHPERRRRGVARALLRHALERARQLQTRLVLLEVRASNRPAIALYSSHGFQPTSRRRGYYANGEDALEMMLTLGGSVSCDPPPLHPER